MDSFCFLYIICHSYSFRAKLYIITRSHERIIQRKSQPIVTISVIYFVEHLLGTIMGTSLFHANSSWLSHRFGSISFFCSPDPKKEEASYNKNQTEPILIKLRVCEPIQPIYSRCTELVMGNRYTPHVQDNLLNHT